MARQSGRLGRPGSALSCEPQHEVRHSGMLGAGLGGNEVQLLPVEGGVGWAGHHSQVVAQDEVQGDSPEVGQGGLISQCQAVHRRFEHICNTMTPFIESALCCVGLLMSRPTSAMQTSI